MIATATDVNNLVDSLALDYWSAGSVPSLASIYALAQTEAARRGWELGGVFQQYVRSQLEKLQTTTAEASGTSTTVSSSLASYQSGDKTLVRGSDGTLRIGLRYDLINYNVKDYGATGNGITDDTTSIQAAITAMTASSAITGRLVFPAGTYKITNAINIGDGTQNLALAIVGLTTEFSGPDGSYPAVKIDNTSVAGKNTFVVKGRTGQSNTLLIDGLYIYNNGGYGVHFASDVPNGVTVRNCTIRAADDGIRFDAGCVSPAIIDVNLMNCNNAGVRLTAAIGPANFRRVMFQAGGAGLVLDTGGDLRGGHFDACVFESHTGDAIYINGGAGLKLAECTFNACWWEAPGRDMIRLVSGGLSDVVFNSPNFDGSSGVGGRHVFNNVAASASNVQGKGITINGGQIVNLNGGRLFSTPVDDPAGSTDPGWLNLTIIGVNGTADIKGVHTQASQPTQTNLIVGTGWDWSNIVVNSHNGANPAVYQKAPFTILGSGSTPLVQTNMPVSVAWIDGVEKVRLSRGTAGGRGVIKMYDATAAAYKYAYIDGGAWVIAAAEPT